MTHQQLVIAQLNRIPSTLELALQIRLKLPLLPISEIEEKAVNFYLRFDEYGLGLQSTTKKAPGSLYVDFKRLTKRVGDSVLQQNLFKAIGARKGKRPGIVDATAGLGTDSFLFAAIGCNVLAIERNPIVFALLEDGSNRFLRLGALEAEIIDRIELCQANFLEAAETLESTQVVYLDPMFPTKNKIAKAKKGMYYLQELIGSSSNDKELLEAAYTVATERIVVKRAKNSPFISVKEPSISFRGSSSRYDVYLLN